MYVVYSGLSFYPCCAPIHNAHYGADTEQCETILLLKLSDIQITSRLTLECSSLETDFCWKYSNFSVDFSSSSVGFLKNHFKADFRLFLLCNRIFFIYSSEIIWIFGGKYSIFVCEIFSFFSGKFYQITSSFTLSCFPIERKQLFSFFLSRKLK